MEVHLASTPPAPSRLSTAASTYRRRRVRCSRAAGQAEHLVAGHGARVPEDPADDGLH